MPDIKQFFDAFANAYKDKNADRIAACYRQPCVLMSNETKHVYSTQEEITKFASHMLSRFEEVGAARHDVTILHSLKMSDDVFFVQVNWEASSQQDVRLFGCHVSYTLKIEPQGSLKIMISVLDDEEQALSQLVAEQ